MAAGFLVRNTNRLLREYPGAIGVKTGTTNEAGQCLIAVAQKRRKTYHCCGIEKVRIVFMMLLLY